MGRIQRRVATFQTRVMSSSPTDSSDRQKIITQSTVESFCGTTTNASRGGSYGSAPRSRESP